jgi:hypothetical protein
LVSQDLVYYFNSILTKGKKDNTYKFALARFLVEYAHGLDNAYIQAKLEGSASETIEFSIIAKAFLEYYWHQICKYKMRQNYNMDKLPLIVQIIQEVFGTKDIPESFQSMKKEKILRAEAMIARRCFIEVIPRFQNITEGISVTCKKEFYEYYNDRIEVKPQALVFFKDNYSFLFKGIILEWAKFLERINIGLPKLISKIQGDEPQRHSLDKFKIMLRNYFDKLLS